MRVIVKLPTRKLTDGTTQTVSLIDWVKETFTGADLETTLAVIDANNELVIAHDAASRATPNPIVENGVVIGWAIDREIDNVDFAPAPGMAELEAKWRADPTLTWIEDVVS
jgi:hypothetical protein